MVFTEVFTARDLDYEAHSDLMRRAFHALFSRAAISNDFMSPAYYRWKYRPPAGEGRTAVVFHGNRMVATSSMFPLHLKHPGGMSRVWQSCDSATLPEARGAGYFTRCLEALIEILPPGEIFFGLPNPSSRRGCEKVGWRPQQVIRTWVGFSRPGFGLPARFSGRFHAELGEHWDRFRPRDRPVLSRDPAYLQWRYLENPCFRYRFFTDISPEGFGFAVARLGSFRRIPFGLVLEWWAREPAVQKALFGQVSRWTLEHGAPLIMTLNSRLRKTDALRNGLLPMPECVLFKNQVLMGTARDPEGQKLFREKWDFQLGDWDGF
ncbi:MAG TPA: GNAT family N-acetyltransferase [Syntrophobacteraceae bacterium]|nr:GNAT family N-acetyltransferase [Syntrophobacteraceae bacterium]